MIGTPHLFQRTYWVHKFLSLCVRYCFLFVLGLIICSAYAQTDTTSQNRQNKRSKPIIYDDQNMIETDRPGYMENPSVVPKGLWQFETGFMIQNDKVLKAWSGRGPNPEKDHIRSITHSSGLIKYGVNGTWELRFAYSYGSEGMVLQKEYQRSDIGFNPFYVGSKVNLFKNDWVSLGFLTHLYYVEGSIDSTASKNSYLAPEFLIPVSFSLNEDISLGVQLGMSWPETYPEPTGMYALTISYQVFDALSTYIQTYGYSVAGSDNKDHRFNGGLLYKVNNKFQLDLSAGLALTEAAPDNFIHIGFSYLFAK